MFKFAYYLSAEAGIDKASVIAKGCVVKFVRYESSLRKYLASDFDPESASLFSSFPRV